MTDKQVQPFQRQLTATMMQFSLIIVLVNTLIGSGIMAWVDDNHASRRLEILSESAIQRFASGETGAIQMNKLMTAYDQYANLPEALQKVISKHWLGNKDFQLGDDQEFVVLSTPVDIGGKSRRLYLVENVSDVEMSSLHENLLHLGVGLLTALFLSIICLVFIFKARRLTHPLQVLTQMIEKSSPDDLEKLSFNSQTQELQQLTDALNNYREIIAGYITRERASSRYISHELRTPLTIIQGATSLLDVSSKPEYIKKQQLRLQQACSSMIDITETLLDLVREGKSRPGEPTLLDKVFLQNIVEEHQNLLRNKPVSVQVNVDNSESITAPQPVLRILVGNLLRNAFAYTQSGSVIVQVRENLLTIEDTGCGLDNKPDNAEGHGLGLMIVNDICRKYGWQFSLENRSQASGSVARVQFSSNRAQYA